MLDLCHTYTINFYIKMGVNLQTVYNKRDIGTQSYV
jgi:hypothetical protein